MFGDYVNDTRYEAKTAARANIHSNIGAPRTGGFPELLLHLPAAKIRKLALPGFLIRSLTPRNNRTPTAILKIPHVHHGQGRGRQARYNLLMKIWHVSNENLYYVRWSSCFWFHTFLYRQAVLLFRAANVINVRLNGSARN